MTFGSIAAVGRVASMLYGPTVPVAWLSALSIAEAGSGLPLWDSSIVSGFVQDWIPDRRSEQLNVTVTGALYQPAEFAARSGEPLIVGLVLSMLIPFRPPLPELPAASV